jgi:hypothetical protein
MLIISLNIITRRKVLAVGCFYRRCQHLAVGGGGIGELLRNPAVAKQPNGCGDRGVGGLHVRHADGVDAHGPGDLGELLVFG